jgi:predicted nucleic acid-binding protein
MNLVFADTYYYLALLSEDDEGHERAGAFSRAYEERVLTTAWVLTEVADALAAPGQRGLFTTLLQFLSEDPNTTILPPSEELFKEGCELYSRRRDKEWSLTDCIYFVAMHEDEVSSALSADHHFEQAGFELLL